MQSFDNTIFRFSKLTFSAAVVIGLAVSGVAAAEVNSAASTPSEADCAARAERASKEASTTAGGVARGGTAGAVIGGIANNSKGARRGAAVGGTIGGARSAGQQDAIYKQTFDNCMAGR